MCIPWLTREIVRDHETLRLVVAAWSIGLLIALAVALGGIVAFLFDRDALTSLGCIYGRFPEGRYPRVSSQGRRRRPA